jgi:hypothetical protein
MEVETEFVKIFIAVDSAGAEHHVLKYVEIPQAKDLTPRSTPRFLTTDGLALEPLDKQEESFKIVGRGVLIKRVGSLAP